LKRARNDAPVGTRITSSPLSASIISTAGGESAFPITAALTPMRSSAWNTLGPNWMP
jgi:hypothetical protein